MFDVYIQEQSIDPRLRSRMVAALTAAVSLTVCAGAVAWGADKLQIHGVAPPQFGDVVTLSIDPEPPPPPAPPARPEPTKAVASDGPTRERAPDREPESADDFLETGKRSDRGPIGKDEGGGDGHGPADAPFRPTTGSPCLIGMNCTTVVGSSRPIEERKPDEREMKVVFEAMKAIYAPDPPQSELGRTRTGLGARGPGKVRVEFCIDARGKVASTRVAKHFPGDTAIDAIARTTVAKWRFKPMLVSGQPRKACSAVTFDIRFD